MSPKAFTVKNDQEIEGFDEDFALAYSSPVVMGSASSISATPEKDGVALSIDLHTPAGSVRKNVLIDGNVAFTWRPFKFIETEISISRYRIVRGRICFVVIKRVCFWLPHRGWICIYTFERLFCIPIFERPFDLKRLTEDQFAQSLMLSHLVEAPGGCNCK